MKPTPEKIAKLPKWAQEFIEHQRYAERISRAMCFTPNVEPDVDPPDNSSELRKGFLFNAHSEEVCPACTNSSSHSFGRDDRTTTQGARRLFSTRLMALRALRHAMELSFAARLARIDALIEEQ